MNSTPEATLKQPQRRVSPAIDHHTETIYSFEGRTFRSGKTVELRNGTFLRITALLPGQTTDSVSLSWVSSSVATDLLGGLLAKNVGEVTMILEYDELDLVAGSPPAPAGPTSWRPPPLPTLVASSFLTAPSTALPRSERGLRPKRRSWRLAADTLAVAKQAEVMSSTVRAIQNMRRYLLGLHSPKNRSSLVAATIRPQKISA